ncbi:MAG: tyrosine-protein phosphatase [Anaerotignum sp.]|nr:tyrosine-protein phosphatase [Anaerotignum sp.]
MKATTASQEPSITDTSTGITPSLSVINMPSSAADTTHAIGLTGVSNARDIGGYKTIDGKTVKAGMLLRTAALAGANDADKKILTEIYNVKIIVDLRYDSEIAQSPELTLPGVTNIHAPILKDISASSSTTSTASSSAKSDKMDTLIGYVKRIGDVDGMINNEYSAMVTDKYSINGYKQFFETILSEHDGAILYHCSGGKDRTGIASMLLLSALGVDRQTAEADYMLTKDFIKGSIDTTTASAAAKGADQPTQDGIELLMSVDQKWADTVFDTINTKYGSMDNFLQEELGLTPDKIDQLKGMYLQ